MLVRATKLGYYDTSLRYPGKRFNYEYSLKKGEKMTPAELKAKTKEVVEKSSWLEPVEEQEPAKAPPATPPDAVQQPASTQAARPEQQPKAPAKAPAKKQAAKTATE
ncbi:MAG: hypothetical protein AB2777_21115 [Candidatus Thiodiazotropha endolucinida]